MTRSELRLGGMHLAFLERNVYILGKSDVQCPVRIELQFF